MNTINRRCMRTFEGYFCFILYTALEKPFPRSIWQQERHHSIAFLIQHSDNGSFAATLRLAKLPASVSSCKLNPPLPFSSVITDTKNKPKTLSIVYASLPRAVPPNLRFLASSEIWVSTREAEGRRKGKISILIRRQFPQVPPKGVTGVDFSAELIIAASRSLVRDTWIAIAGTTVTAQISPAGCAVLILKGVICLVRVSFFSNCTCSGLPGEEIMNC